MPKQIQAHIPYLRLADNLNHFCHERYNPEVYFSSDALDTLELDCLAGQARILHEAGLSTTIHATFMDLNPGSHDRIIRDATRCRFEQIFEAAGILRPRVIVFHPGYDDLRYGNAKQAWLDNSVEFWNAFLPMAEELDTVIAIENIFEKEPSMIRRLLETVDDQRFRHCFDVGHWNMFKIDPLEEWFAELGTFIVEAHIHDNHGQADEHLPPGEGGIDFTKVFQLLEQHAPDAIWTMEAHSNERLARAFKAVDDFL